MFFRFKKIRYKIVWQKKYYKTKKRGDNLEYSKYKNKALEISKNRIAHFNNLYKFKVNRITIKNQKTRWGSCSKKGNLNFNYKIAILPQYLSDYIIVHELCHLGEFNHSKNFWSLVAKTIPNYKKIKKQFKTIHLYNKKPS